MENPYNQLCEEFAKLKGEIFEESKSKFPSVHSLRSGAQKIMNSLKNSTIKDPEFVTWADWERRYLDIFIEDLTGELEHDYEKRNVRYTEKWNQQKEKLVKHLVDYKEKFKEKIEEE